MSSTSPATFSSRVGASARQRLLAAVLIGIAIALQWMAFREFSLREVLPVFPRMYDQTAYLGQASDIYQAIVDRGFLSASKTAWTMPSPQGALLQQQAAAAYLFVGPDRLSALMLNFLYFAGFQIALLWVASWLGRPWLALPLCGALASASFVWHPAGGMLDFRLDFAAACLLGIILCVVLRSCGLRLARWSVLVGLLFGLLGLTRTITLTYLGGGTLLFLLFLLVARNIPHRAIRARNLIAAWLTASVFIVPYLFVQRSTIYAYYVIGHGASDEKYIRAREFGVYTALDHVTYYAISAIRHHAGRTFCLLMAVFLLAMFASRLSRLLRTPRREPDSEAAAHEIATHEATPYEAWTHDLICALVFIAAVAAAAYTIFSADYGKSPVVGSMFIASALPFACGLWLLVRGVSPAARSLEPAWTYVVFLGVFLAGQAAFLDDATGRSQLPVSKDDSEEFMTVADTFATVSDHLELTAPVVSFDELTEFFHTGVFKVLAFERRGLRLDPQPGFGAIRIGLRGVSKAETEVALRRSDFAFIGLDRAGNSAELYPLNQSLRTYAAELYALASREMVPLRETAFFGRRLTMFVKPSVACTGNDGGWISARGMDCRTVGAVLRNRPVMTFEGAAPLQYLPGRPSVTAIVSDEADEVARMPCALDAPAQPVGASQPYVVRCDFSDIRVARSDRVDISLRFDRYFVPQQIGLNEDPRPLVVPWPARIATAPAPLAPAIPAPPAADRRSLRAVSPAYR